MKTINKQERIEQLIARIEIERNATGLYAVVPSLTTAKKYFLDIDESSFAVGPCQCSGAKRGYVCQHWIATSVIIEASRRATLDRVCATYARPVATACSMEQAIEEAETMLAETPDEVAAVEGAIAEEGDWKAQLGVWHEQQRGLTAFYDIRGHEVAAAMLPVCDGCCTLFKSSYAGQTTCNRCDA